MAFKTLSGLSFLAPRMKSCRLVSSCSLRAEALRCAWEAHLLAELSEVSSMEKIAELNHPL